MKDYLVYETKCRRCDTIHEWAWSKQSEYSDFENWQRLHRYISEVMNYPTTNPCDTCNKTTIQDYVSLSDKPQE